MSWTTNDIGDLAGHTVLVTGANSGIGFEAARVFARKGALVILACRDQGKSQAALERLTAETPTAKLELLSLDLSNLASVRAAARSVLERHPRLHALINNAGVMAIPHALTQDGFEMQIGVNHFGHFALTGLLIDRLLHTPGARIVNVSSIAHRIGSMHFDDLDFATHYEKWTAYGQSKLANLLFTFELARRLEQKHADVICAACHPGYASTNLQFVGPQLAQSGVSNAIMHIGNTLFAQSAQGGALPTLYAATETHVKNGEFIGPQFLQWRGTPGRVAARKAAHNPELMTKLWAVSMQRTGVDFAALG